MPGKMGFENVTVKNLKVLQVDDAAGILVVHGMFNKVAKEFLWNVELTSIFQDMFQDPRTRLFAFKMPWGSRGLRGQCLSRK